MAISAFDLFSVGIGPSSSHTVGPMRAAHTFAEGLRADGLLERVGRVRAELFGSLGATGHGHGSVKAVVLGLEGEAPETTDPRGADPRLEEVRASGILRLAGTHEVRCAVDTDVVLHRRATLPFHANGMRFTAYASPEPVEDEEPLRERDYYSVGGGFVLDEDEVGENVIVPDHTPVRLPLHDRRPAARAVRGVGLPISGVMMANEQAWRTEAEVRDGLLHLWQVMQECVDAGCRVGGRAPRGLKVPRRAPRSPGSCAPSTPATRSPRWTG